jgi:hypothetical protein
MRWSIVDISFEPEDHSDTELSNMNPPFVVKIPIGRHNVASLNLMMRKAFIEMSLNLAELTPMHDTFYGIIPRAVVHSYWTHQDGGLLWVRGKQA